MPSPAFDLSFIIPARNEYFHDLDLLHYTIQNVLANTTRANIIVILDGYDNGWPLRPLPVDPRLTVIHHSKSIGQRAACNEGVRASSAKFICKLDAHCAIGPQFDELMMAQCDYETTLIPVQYNLEAFNWLCKKCRHRTYQGPKPAKCVKCGSRYLKILPVWQPRGWKERDGVWEGRPKTTAWYFDTELRFQYAGDMQQRFKPDERGLTPTMTCLGACWMLHRDRYWELDGMDEQAGSWGQQGVELCLKSHLSGGQVMTNHNTWFAHLFRTQQGFGFPYANPGVDKARARSRELWLENKWSKQKYPLSWLIEKFKPVRDWHTVESHPLLVKVNSVGELFTSSVFPVSSGCAFSTYPTTLTAPEDVAPNTQSLSAVDDANGAGISGDVFPVVGDEFQVDGITAGLVVADDVIQNGDISATAPRKGFDQPSVHVSMGQFDVPTVPVRNVPISIPVSGASPDPAVQRPTTHDTGKDTSKLSQGWALNDKQAMSHGLTITNPVTVGYLYYTCNSHDLTLELAARNNLLRSKKGREIGCVSRERTDFGDWNIVVQREKSGTTMHYQILAGLERMCSDVVFLCESDVFYHESHFDFLPTSGIFHYNTNVWRVRYSDGHAVRTDGLQQVSGICANRELLLAHYRKRVQWIEANGGVFDTKRMAYEPGTRGKFGDERVANWESPYPNLDITGHGNTLTVPHFSVDSFRNKKYAVGWRETDEALPGWEKISGRVQQWLSELAGRGENIE